MQIITVFDQFEWQRKKKGVCGGYKELDEIALSAVKQMMYFPPLKDGLPQNYLGMKRKYTFSIED